MYYGLKYVQYTLYVSLKSNRFFQSNYIHRFRRGDVRKSAVACMDATVVSSVLSLYSRDGKRDKESFATCFPRIYEKLRSKFQFNDL